MLTLYILGNQVKIMMPVSEQCHCIRDITVNGRGDIPVDHLHAGLMIIGATVDNTPEFPDSKFLIAQSMKRRHIGIEE